MLLSSGQNVKIVTEKRTKTQNKQRGKKKVGRKDRKNKVNKPFSSRKWTIMIYLENSRGVSRAPLWPRRNDGRETNHGHWHDAHSRAVAIRRSKTRDLAWPWSVRRFPPVCQRSQLACSDWGNDQFAFSEWQRYHNRCTFSPVTLVTILSSLSTRKFYYKLIAWQAEGKNQKMYEISHELWVFDYGYHDVSFSFSTHFTTILIAVYILASY